MLPVLHNNCSSQIPLLRMAQATFLLLSLPLFLLLHVGQATTCQGDNCPTGEYYLESKTMAYNWTHCSNWINDNLPLLFEFDCMQDWLSPEEVELLQQALKLSQLRPTARSLLFLNQVTSPLLIISLLNILLPRERGPLPLCHQPRKTTGCLWRLLHQDFLHLLARWSRGLERLPHTEVRFIFNLSYHSHVSYLRSNTLVEHSQPSYLSHIIPLFRKGRTDHAAVMMGGESIVIVGGRDSSTETTGEIVPRKLTT